MKKQSMFVFGSCLLFMLISHSERIDAGVSCVLKDELTGSHYCKSIEGEIRNVPLPGMVNCYLRDGNPFAMVLEVMCKQLNGVEFFRSDEELVRWENEHAKKEERETEEKTTVTKKEVDSGSSRDSSRENLIRPGEYCVVPNDSDFTMPKKARAELVTVPAVDKVIYFLPDTANAGRRWIFENGCTGPQSTGEEKFFRTAEMLTRWISGSAGEFSQTDFDKLGETNKCRQCSLSGADLSGLDLTGADLWEVNLIGANLTGTNLTGAILVKSELNQADLSNATMIGTRLRESDLTKANLRNADLTDAKLQNTNLTGVDLTSANLADANLRQSILIDAVFRDTKVDRTSLSKANLSGVDLSKLDLIGDVNSHRRLDLSESDLTNSDLSGLDLRRVNLKKSKLVGANLYRTNLSFVDLYGADLSDANLTLADLTRAIVWRSNVTGTDFTDTNLSEVKFSEEQIASNEMLRMRKKEDENRIAEEKRKEEEKELLAEAKRKQEQAKRVLEENREKEERERLAKELAAQLTEMIKDSGSVSQPTDGSESDTPKLLDQGTSGNISSAPSQTESASASVASNSPINQDAVGYKDLKVGMTLEEIKELNVCPRITERPYKLESGTCYQDFRAFLVGYCYGKNWEFTFRFDKAFKGNSRTCIAEPDFVVEQIEIDLGQFVEEKHDQFRDLLNKKYQSDYKFTDIDVERYNNQETTGLYDLYSRGKVALVIARTKAYVLFPNDLSRHFSIIQYNSDLRARKLIESVIPEKLDASDF